MADEDGNGDRFRDVAQESKALWAAMRQLETHLDRKMDALLVEHLYGGTLNRDPLHGRSRVFPRVRGGGRC